MARADGGCLDFARHERNSEPYFFNSFASVFAVALP